MALNLDFSAVLDRWPSLLDGAVLTLELAFTATILGGVIGVLGAIGRRSPHPIVVRLWGIYVEAIRNTPLLVQIFLVYFGLSSLGLQLSAVFVAALSLTINVGAYTTEIIRAGFDAIPRGQIEAAQGLALSRAQIYWHVVLLPALERVYPSLTSQFVLLMLASSVTSQISARGADGGRELHPVRHLPGLRNLHRRGADLRRAVARHAGRLLRARPAPVPAPAPARDAAVRGRWAER